MAARPPGPWARGRCQLEISEPQFSDDLCLEVGQMVGLDERLTDHLPGRDALGRGHLIDGREDLPGQGGSLSCQRTPHRILDVDGQQVRGARRPPQVRPEVLSCCGGGRQRGQQPEEMAGGRISIGVGGCDHCDAGDALHIEPAGLEMRSQVQWVFQLVCERGGYVGADFRSIGDPRA